MLTVAILAHRVLATFELAIKFRQAFRELELTLEHYEDELGRIAFQVNCLTAHEFPRYQIVGVALDGLARLWLKAGDVLEEFNLQVQLLLLYPHQTAAELGLFERCKVDGLAHGLDCRVAPIIVLLVEERFTTKAAFFMDLIDFLEVLPVHPLIGYAIDLELMRTWLTKAIHLLVYFLFKHVKFACDLLLNIFFFSSTELFHEIGRKVLHAGEGRVTIATLPLSLLRHDLPLMFYMALESRLRGEAAAVY